MRIGVDQYTLHHLVGVGGVGLLEWARAHGLDGCQFQNIREISPLLDHNEIRQVHEYARVHRMYIEVGIPCPNPHLPGQLALQDGDGDLNAGLRRHLEAIAIALAGTRSVRCFIGGPGARHRHSVSWRQQVRDTIALVRDLVPLLRDLDLRLAFENHAEATTFELIRAVEELGMDVAGINLDTGNLMIALEDPLAAVCRAAPYTIATHLKDGILVFAEDGLSYNARPCGQGILPLPAILKELFAQNPDLTLSIEDHAGLYAIPVFSDEYLATFPDLQPFEFAHLFRTARACEQQISAGALASPAAVEAIPWEDRALERLDNSTRYVRDLASQLGIHASSQ